MRIHPIVETIIWIAFIASFIPPIISMIKYDAAVRKICRDFVKEMEAEITKFKADPKNYKAKKY